MPREKLRLWVSSKYLLVYYCGYLRFSVPLYTPRSSSSLCISRKRKRGVVDWERAVEITKGFSRKKRTRIFGDGAPQNEGRNVGNKKRKNVVGYVGPKVSKTCSCVMRTMLQRCSASGIHFHTFFLFVFVEDWQTWLSDVVASHAFWSFSVPLPKA